MSKIQLEDKFISSLKNVLEKRGLDKKITFSQPLNESGLGLDSMGRLDLLIEIEKEFEIEFPEICWGTNSFHTAGEILEYLKSILSL